MAKITLSELIAQNKPKAAIRLLALYGAKPATSREMLQWQIEKAIIRRGEPFLKELALIHPHRDLILASVEEKEPEAEKEKIREEYQQEVKKEEVQHNFVCPHFDGKAETKKEEIPAPAVPVKEQTHNISKEIIIKSIVIGSIGVLLGVAIFKQG